LSRMGFSMSGRMRDKKLNNKGFSLVELMIAVSILAVIGLTIAMFMGSSSNMYTRTNTEATLQAEAQVVANGISDLMIDCTSNIDYNRKPIDNSKINNLNMSINYGDKTDGYILQIVNDLEQYLILFAQEEEKIYYLESTRVRKTQPFPNYNYDEKQILAEHVSDFKVNTERYEKEHIIWFELSYTKNDKTYNGDYQVNIRNHITLEEDDQVEDEEDNRIKSIIVTPSEYYIHVINGIPYTSANQPLKTVSYKAVVKPGTQSQDVEWMFSETDVGMGFLPYQTDPNATPEEGGEAPESQQDKNPASIYVDPDGENLTRKTFKVIATKNGVQGEGVVYVRKVTDVNVSHVSGLVSVENSSGGSSMKANRSGTVVLSCLVEGWNLGTNNKGIKWLIETKQGAAGQYEECKDANIASIASNNNSCSLVLGPSANTNTYFRVTATSTFDGSKYDTIEFGVKSSKDTSGNKTFARGVYVDLASYFTAYGVGHWICDEFISMRVINVPNLDENSADVFIVTDDGKLYVDYEAANLKYYGDRLELFYKEMTVQVEVKFMGWSSNYTDYREHTETCHITLPAVEVYKTNSDLISRVRAWNNSTLAEQNEIKKNSPKDSYDNLKQEMKNLDATDSNIVIAKGNAKAAYFYIQSYNIVKPELIGAHVMDSSDSFYGTNIMENGYEGANEYITATLTSSLGTKNKLQDTGVVTFKATSAKASPSYPVDKIPVNVSVKDFYMIKKAVASYTTFNIYIANVEGTSVFIPGPESSEWDSSKRYSSNWTEITTGPADTRVKIAKLTNSAGKSYYQLYYNNATYIYNTTYNYWAEQ